MTNIDLAIMMPAPENPVRAQNEANNARAIRQKALDIAWTKWEIQQARWNISNRKCLMIIRGSISNGIRMTIPEWATATSICNGEELVHWFFQPYAATLAEQHMTMKYAGGEIR